MSTGSDYPFLVPRPRLRDRTLLDGCQEPRVQTPAVRAMLPIPLAAPNRPAPTASRRTTSGRRCRARPRCTPTSSSPSPVFPQWREIAPYNVVQVAPDEAPNVHMVSNVVEVDNADLKIGMPLEIVYDDVTSEDTIFRWKPA